jgi:hypothetical protein
VIGIRALLTKIQILLKHPLLLGSVLIFSCLAFSVHPGALGEFMAAGGIVFLLNAIVGNYRLREATGAQLAVLALVAIIVLVHVLSPAVKVRHSSLRYLLFIPGMVMACHLMALSLSSVHTRTFNVIATAVLYVCVACQMIAVWWNKPEGLFGFYGNLHHLGFFASIALPLLGWIASRVKCWTRMVLAPCLMAAMVLLWQSSSRVSWLVFFSSVILSAALFLNRKQFLGFILIFCMVSVSAVLLSGPSAVMSRINDLVVNFWNEERITIIWPETIDALQRNSLREWLFGHGIGSFRFSYKINPFPHNALLQLLFENGLIVTLLVVAAFGYLMWALWRSSRQRPRRNDHRLAATLFLLLCIEIGHCLLTKSLYSKYILYTLSLIVGVSLVVIEKSRSRIRPQPGAVDPAGVSRADSPQLERDLSGRPG